MQASGSCYFSGFLKIVALAGINFSDLRMAIAILPTHSTTFTKYWWVLILAKSWQFANFAKLNTR